MLPFILHILFIKRHWQKFNYCLLPEKSTRILHKLEHTPACTDSHTGIVCKTSQKNSCSIYHLVFVYLPFRVVMFDSQPISATILVLILNIPVILISLSPHYFIPTQGLPHSCECFLLPPKCDLTLQLVSLLEFCVLVILYLFA